MRHGIVLLAAVQAVLCLLANGAFHPVSGNHYGLAGTNETFDYVVIGGGTAGLAMAYRLSADTSNSVAVVEAGAFSSM